MCRGASSPVDWSAGRLGHSDDSADAPSCHAVQVQQPCLQHYLNAHLVTTFVAFLMQWRDVDKPTLQFHVYTAFRVVCWLKACGMVQPCTALAGHEKWLLTLHDQLGSNIISKKRSADDSVHLAAVGKWCEPERLTALVHSIQQKAQQAVSSMAQPSLDTAIQVHQALLACMFWGYLPPL